MKFDRILKGLFTTIFAAGLCSLPATLNAQSQQNAPQQNQPPSAQQQNQPSSAQQQYQQPSAQQQQKTFTGTIVKLRSGKYALVTGKTPQGGAAGHFLDDQKDAAKYAGKAVEVTGTFDIASNMIHVSKIRPAA